MSALEVKKKAVWWKLDSAPGTPLAAVCVPPSRLVLSTIWAPAAKPDALFI